MALEDYLVIDHKAKKIGLSEERVMALLPVAAKYIAFWREYPDLLVDFLKGKDSNFELYPYQRVFLRAIMRYRYSFMTFPRDVAREVVVTLPE